jgi:hypothetical protein
VEALDWAVLVVHDVLPGNDTRIDRLLGLLEDRGHELVQEPSPACVPIRRGERLAPIDDYLPL